VVCVCVCVYVCVCLCWLVGWLVVVVVCVCVCVCTCLNVFECVAPDSQQEGVLYFLNPSDIPDGQLAWPDAAGKRRSTFKRGVHAARIKSLNQLTAVDAREKMAVVGGKNSSPRHGKKMHLKKEVTATATTFTCDGGDTVSSPRIQLQTSGGPVPIVEDLTVNTEANVRATVSMSLSTLETYYHALYVVLCWSALCIFELFQKLFPLSLSLFLSSKLPNLLSSLHPPCTRQALQGFQPFVSNLPPHVEKGLLPVRDNLHAELNRFFRKQSRLCVCVLLLVFAV
jgi:hypothetical protein